MKKIIVRYKQSKERDNLKFILIFLVIATLLLNISFLSGYLNSIDTKVGGEIKPIRTSIKDNLSQLNEDTKSMSMSNNLRAAGLKI